MVMTSQQSIMNSLYHYWCIHIQVLQALIITIQDKKDAQSRKVFIGGLNYNTTEDGLKEHFGCFGEIVDVVVMKFPDTKRYARNRALQCQSGKSAATSSDIVTPCLGRITSYQSCILSEAAQLRLWSGLGLKKLLSRVQAYGSHHNSGSDLNLNFQVYLGLSLLVISAVWTFSTKLRLSSGH